MDLGAGAGAVLVAGAADGLVIAGTAELPPLLSVDGGIFYATNGLALVGIAQFWHAWNEPWYVKN